MEFTRLVPANKQLKIVDSHVLTGSSTRRCERARRALRTRRRAALLGFPLPAAQRIDARYEKTCRAVAEKPPSRVRVVVGKGRYIRHTAPQVGDPLHLLTTHGGAGEVVGRSNEQAPAIDARPAWGPEVSPSRLPAAPPPCVPAASRRWPRRLGGAARAPCRLPVSSGCCVTAPAAYPPRALGSLPPPLGGGSMLQRCYLSLRRLGVA